MKKKRRKIMKVLIADDSEYMRERLIDMLSDIKEIEIIGQAQDVPETIKSIRELRPDVVTLDIRMPGGNGIDVLQKIKKYKKALIVIMFTNYPFPQYKKKCMDLGADFFFDKSTEFEKTNKVLKQLVQQRISGTNPLNYHNRWETKDER